MPTGYTEIIAREDISFEQFAIRCSRAFGVLVEFKDEGLDAKIPDELPVSDYHAKELKTAEEDYKHFIALSDLGLNKLFKKEAADDKARKKKTKKEETILRSKYQNMLTNAESWNPPTPEHKGIKDFMIKQLMDSIDHDCNSSSYFEAFPDFTAWKAKKMKSLAWNVKYHAEQLEKDKKRGSERNAWWSAFKNSLTTQP